MLESIFANQMTIAAAAVCTAVSLGLGALIALIYKWANKDCTAHFLVALLLLPALVQCVIMMVNGNLGAGVAVAGAFSLVRFRSAQGSAQEICIIFLAMAAGLTIGMGYVAFAAAFTVVLLLAFLLACRLLFSPRVQEKQLKILIPEDVDYMEAFEDLFQRYTCSHRLIRTKTTNMGSLYQLTYRLRIKEPAFEKEFLDALRCRNGNLTVSLMAAIPEKETL